MSLSHAMVLKHCQGYILSESKQLGRHISVCGSKTGVSGYSHMGWAVSNAASGGRPRTPDAAEPGTRREEFQHQFTPEIRKQQKIQPDQENNSSSGKPIPKKEVCLAWESWATACLPGTKPQQSLLNSSPRSHHPPWGGVISHGTYVR